MPLSLIGSIELLISGIVVVIGILLGEKLPGKVVHKFQTSMVSLTPLEQVIFLEGPRKKIRTWEMILVAAVPLAWIFTAAPLSNPDASNPWFPIIILAIPLSVTTLWYIMKRTRRAMDIQLLATKQKQHNHKLPKLGAPREQALD